MKPDSIPSRTAALLLDETRRLGRPVSLPELFRAWGEQHERRPKNQISHALHVLVKRGLAVKVGGAIGSQQYCHCDHPLSPPVGSSVTLAVAEATRQAVLDLGRAASTREILPRLGSVAASDLTFDQLRTKLESISHGSERKRKRGHGTLAEPLVVKHVRVSAGGARSVFWTPIDSEAAAPVVRTTQDFVCDAVRFAERDLGRPVTKREIRLWARAKEAEGGTDAEIKAAAEARRRGFSARLTGVVFSSEARGVRAVHTPFTSRGAYPCRYTAASGHTSDHSALVSDLAVLLRPADELEGLEDLAVEGGFSGDLVQEILAVRRTSARRVVTDMAPDRGSAGWITNAIGQWAEGVPTMLDWIDHIPGFPSQRQQEVDTLRGLERQILALGELVDSTVVHPAPERVVTVADSPGVRLGVLKELSEEVSAVTGRDPRHWRHLVAGARRIRGPIAGGISASDERQVESLLDRPDALLVLADDCPLPKLGAAVADAHLLLGELVRDPDVVRAWLQKCRPAEVRLRHGLAVALAMLGVVAPIDLVWPVADNVSDLEVYLLTVALACDDLEGRIRLGIEAERRAEGPASALMELALPRLEIGDRLSIID